MSDTPNLSIGEFSSRARLSVRMLRHYDEHGLLHPAEVDERTGYRRYSAAQLDRAATIRRLRDVGFTVSAIAAVLAARGSDAYAQALLLQRDLLQREVDDAQERLVLIEHLIRSEENTMTEISVSRATVPAMTVVALRGTIPSYDREDILWARFLPLLQEQGIIPVGAVGVIEHDGEYVESDADVSVWMPVAPGTTVAAPLEIHEFASRATVVARVNGPYSLITESHARIDEFARAEGITIVDGEARRSLADHNFNIYRVGPDTAPPADFVTDVYMVAE